MRLEVLDSRASDRAAPGTAIVSKNGRRAQKWLDEIHARLPKMFESPRLKALEGLPRNVAKLLCDASSIELATLTDEDKVRFEGGRLLVHRAYPELLARRPGVKQKDRRCLLYVAHEVAHICQGISAKARVARLRKADGEETLLQLDLEADHAAAVVASAVLNVPLATVKQTSLAMLRAFPAGVGHSPGATQRKARRAVALAADVVSRDLGLVYKDTEYAFLHWPRGGGHAELFARGVYSRSLCSFDVSPNNAGRFDGAANETSRTSQLLDALRRQIGRSRLQTDEVR